MPRKAVKLALIAALVVFSGDGRAASSYVYGAGGNLTYFDRIIDQADKSGEMFRIEGSCRSACTMFLRIRNVCVEQTAELEFHAAHTGSNRIVDGTYRISQRGIGRLLQSYRPALRAYLLANHYLDSNFYHTISGADMNRRFGYRQCPAK